MANPDQFGESYHTTDIETYSHFNSNNAIVEAGRAAIDRCDDDLKRLRDVLAANQGNSEPPAAESSGATSHQAQSSGAAVSEDMQGVDDN